MRIQSIERVRANLAGLAVLYCVGSSACASPAADPAQAGPAEASSEAKVTATSAALRTPFAIIPASAETVAATQVTKWTLHRLSSGAVLVSGWNDHKVVSFVRLSSGRDDSIHLDYGKHAGVIVYDKAGNVVAGYARAALQQRAKIMSYFGTDLSNDDKQPYDCTFDIIAATGGLLVATGTCAPLVATGPLAPGTLTACIGAQVVNFGAGYLFGIDCAGFASWYSSLGNGEFEEVSECEGGSCTSGDPIYFEAGGEGFGDGSGGTGGTSSDGSDFSGGDDYGDDADYGDYGDYGDVDDGYEFGDYGDFNYQ